MIVAAEPILLETASPIRNGSGFRPASIKERANIGVNAKHTISLANSADNKALTSMVTNHNNNKTGLK